MTEPKLKSLLGHSPLTDAYLGVDVNGNIFGINEDGSAFAPSASATGLLVSELRSAVGNADGDIRYLRGYSTAGDGGEGLFRWSTVSATDDGGTIFNTGGLGSSGVGWRRVAEGHHNVKWFGAKGDGATDDRAAIQRAIDAAIVASVTYKKTGTVFFPPGKYVLNYGVSAGSGLPLRCFYYNAGTISAANINLLGDSDPFDFGSSGTFSGSLIVQNDPTQAALVFHTARQCVIEKICLQGRNTYNTSVNLNDPVNHYDSVWNTTWDSISDAPYVLTGCRTNAKSPHCGIAVDPFFNTIAGGDQYPGMSTYYAAATIEGSGGSSAIIVRRCYIRDFVVGVGISLSGHQANAELFDFENTAIVSNKDGIAIGQNQSRNTRIWGGVLGNGYSSINCKDYGTGNGTAPYVYGTQLGGRYAIIGAGAGSDGLFSGCYSESLMALGHFGGDRYIFDGGSFGFYSAPSGYPTYARVLAATARPTFRACKFTISLGDDDQPHYFNAAEFLDSTQFVNDISPTLRPVYHMIGSALHDREVPYFHTDGLEVKDNANYRSWSGAPIQHRDVESNFASIAAPRGGGFFTTLQDSSPRLSWLDSELRLVQPGSLSTTINTDGTATISGTTLEQTFAIGDMVEAFENLTNVVKSSLSEPVPVCLGRVTGIAPGSPTVVTCSFVPTYVVEALGSTTTSKTIFLYKPAKVQTPSTGTLASTTSITSVTPSTYWKQYDRIQDEDGFLGTSNYVSVIAGSTITLAAPASVGSGSVYLHDQPRWDVLKGFATLQSRPVTSTTSLGQLNGARTAADVDFSVWTPRAAYGAAVLAGSTDKVSGNGAWCSIGGWGSGAAATLASKSALTFGGPATTALLVRSTAADGTTAAVWGRLYKSGALAVGDATNNDTSSEAQAGLTGPLVNIAPITGGSLTTVANQACIYNDAGAAVVQGDSGVAINVGTTQTLLVTSATLTASCTTLGIAQGQSSPLLRHNQRTGDNPTSNFTIAGQAASASATGANENGGHLLLKGGAKDGAGTDGSSKLQDGAGNTIVEAAGGTKLGFFNATAVVRPTAYTQTYATATRTHSNPTGATLTDSSGGTADQTVANVTDPADSPGTADALRDDLVANTIPVIRNNFADVTDEINKLIADVANVKQVLNQLLDDLQAFGLLQ